MVYNPSDVFLLKTPAWPFLWWLHEVHIEFSTENSVVLAGAVMKAASVLGLIGYEIMGMGGLKKKAIHANSMARNETAAHEAAFANSDIKKLIALSSVFHASHFAISKKLN